MKQAILILITFVALSCTKQNAAKMSEVLPLKSIPAATANGKEITFDASKSTGNIKRYGWALDITSPTDGGTANPISWSTSFSSKTGEFVLMKATVTKPGMYYFGLTVYDEISQDYQLVHIEVK